MMRRSERMERKKKIFHVFMLVICMIFCMNHIALAMSGSDLTKKFDGQTTIDTKQGEELVQDVADVVLSVVRIVAIGIAVVMITLLGIKYVVAAPSEKANIKNQLITFTIGAVVVIGTTSILTIIKNAVGEITKI